MYETTCSFIYVWVYMYYKTKCLGVRKSDSQYQKTRSPKVGLRICETRSPNVGLPINLKSYESESRTHNIRKTRSPKVGLRICETRSPKVGLPINLKS